MARRGGVGDLKPGAATVFIHGDRDFMITGEEGHRGVDGRHPMVPIVVDDQQPIDPQHATIVTRRLEGVLAVHRQRQRPAPAHHKVV